LSRFFYSIDGQGYKGQIKQSCILNDDVLQNYHFASYRYWGDRVTLKDAVEFKQSDSLY